MNTKLYADLSEKFIQFRMSVARSMAYNDEPDKAVIEEVYALDHLTDLLKDLKKLHNQFKGIVNMDAEECLRIEGFDPRKYSKYNEGIN